MEKGFDNVLYVEKQTAQILDRIGKFDNKLYLEFGGKLFDDLHAARCLPGFDPNVKTKILQNLKDKTEIIFCISALDLENNKIRGDFGITYGAELLRLMQNLRELGLYINSVVITQFNEQGAALIYKNKLERLGEKVYIHRLTKGYPNDVNLIVSDEGYGANPYIETTRPLVVVNAPGPNSGKLATCLSQLYHEYKRGVRAGYAKFETFPVWNLPLKHPVNIAYEAATADIKDRNLIDYYHLDAYGVSAVNYNRDLEIFPVVKNILSRILGSDKIYQSPTDMGVNMVGYAICNDEAVQNACKQEVIRRYYNTYCDYKHGRVGLDTAHRVEILMNNLGVSTKDRAVVAPALQKAKDSGRPAVAIQLADGKIVTGRETALIQAAASVVINAIKYLANIDDRIMLIAPVALDTMRILKEDILNTRQTKLNLEEALIALSFSAPTNPTITFAMAKLNELRNTEAHSSCILDDTEMRVFQKLGVNLTSEAEFV